MSFERIDNDCLFHIFSFITDKQHLNDLSLVDKRVNGVASVNGLWAPVRRASNNRRDNLNLSKKRNTYLCKAFKLSFGKMDVFKAESLINSLILQNNSSEQINKMLIAELRDNDSEDVAYDHIKWLLELGVKLGMDQDSLGILLGLALHWKHTEKIIVLLMEAGACPNEYTLNAALEVGAPMNIIKLFLDAGARFNQDSLDLALSFNSPKEIIELILKTRVASSDKYSQNIALLHKASDEVIDLLLKANDSLKKKQQSKQSSYCTLF